MHRFRALPRPALAVFAIIFAASALYTVTRPKVYEATALLTVLPRQTKAAVDAESARVRSSGEDIRHFIRIAESKLVSDRVEARIDQANRELLIRPFAPDTTVETVLLGGRRVAEDDRRPGGLRLSFRHHQPLLAASVANLFADEIRAFLVGVRLDNEKFALEDLAQRVRDQRERVDATAEALAKARQADAAPTADTSTSDLVIRLEQEERVLALIIERQLETNAYLTRDHSAAYPLTPATPPAPGDYVSPDHLLHLSLGALLGLAAAFLTTRLRRTT